MRFKSRLGAEAQRLFLRECGTAVKLRKATWTADESEAILSFRGDIEKLRILLEARADVESTKGAA